MKEYAYIHEEGKIPPALQNLPLLKDFKEPHLNDILYSSYFLECDPGDVFIEEGAKDSRIYVLLTGTVKVMKGGEQIAESDTPGDLFGELAVVDASTRSASVVAKSRTLLLVVDQQFLQELRPIEENEGFYAAVYGFLAKILAVRLRATSQELARVEKELEDLKKRATAAASSTN